MQIGSQLAGQELLVHVFSSANPHTPAQYVTCNCLQHHLLDPDQHPALKYFYEVSVSTVPVRHGVPLLPLPPHLVPLTPVPMPPSTATSMSFAGDGGSGVGGSRRAGKLPAPVQYGTGVGMLPSPVLNPNTTMRPAGLDHYRISQARQESSVPAPVHMDDSGSATAIERHCVVVTEIDPEVSETLLGNWFSWAGKVTDLEMKRNVTGNNTNSAIIRFESEEAKSRAIQKFNGRSSGRYNIVVAPESVRASIEQS